MNDLQVFSKDIIPVYVTDEGEKVVMGRELHERLKIKTDYKDWFPRMCEYGFTEPEDYAVFEQVVGSQKRARTYSQKNHILKFNMAKHIATIQRTPIGKAIRDKLIALEEKVSSGGLSVDGIGAIASLLREERLALTAQKSSGSKIARQVELTLKTFGVPVLPDFVEPSYEQVKLTLPTTKMQFNFFGDNVQHRS